MTRKSSSNRATCISDAVIVQDHKNVGPLRLPDHRAGDFVAHFNRIYQVVGLKIAELNLAKTVSSQNALPPERSSMPSSGDDQTALGKQLEETNPNRDEPSGRNSLNEPDAMERGPSD